MKRIQIDEDKWRGMGLTFARRDDVYRFMLDGRSDVIDAPIEGERIYLTEERSAAHKALAGALGYSSPD